MVRKTASVRESAAPEVSPLRRAHRVVDDTIEKLDLRVKALLNSPKHDTGTLNSYVDALEKLVRLAVETDAAARASPSSGGSQGGPAGAVRGVAIVPGIIADREEWQRQMGLLEASRSERGS